MSWVAPFQTEQDPGAREQQNQCGDGDQLRRQRELDAMARAFRATAVADRADVEMCDELGLSRVDVRRLKDGAALLRNRRTGR